MLFLLKMINLNIIRNLEEYFNKKRHRCAFILSESLPDFKDDQNFSWLVGDISAHTFIRQLMLEFEFNQPFNVPHGVIYLMLGHHYNKQLYNLPNTIRFIQFGYSYNRLSFDIPNSVTYIAFGNKFNQPIKNKIPSSVKYLVFGNHFNQPLGDNIPLSVTHLAIGMCYAQPLKENIPLSVTNLSLIDNNLYYIPEFVVFLSIYRYTLDIFPCHIIPESVTRITVIYNEDEPPIIELPSVKVKFFKRTENNPYIPFVI